MIINLVLILLFVMSTALLWYRLSIKIPELIAIPDRVILERLHEDSAKLRLFLLHIKIYYRERQYQKTLAGSSAKFLYRIHVALLRADNSIVRLLKKMKAQSGNGNIVESANTRQEAMPPKMESKMEEVRKKE